MAVMKKTISEFINENGNYFRMPNQIFDADVTLEAKLIWAYLMSQPEDWSSGRNNLSRNLGMHRDTISKRINELVEAKMLAVKTNDSGRYDFLLLPPNLWKPKNTAQAETEPPGSPDMDYETAYIQDLILKTNNIAHPAVGQADQATAAKWDLEAIYSKYPKKVGKARGMKKLAKLVTSQKLYDDLMAAVVNYDRYCKAEKRDKQYIKQFDVFLNDHWQDFVSPESSSAVEKYEDWDV